MLPPVNTLDLTGDPLRSMATAPKWHPQATNGPAAVLGLMMFLLPTLGVPHELMLQDTLKSAIAAFGVLLAALLFFWQQRHRTEPMRWHGLVWLPLVLLLYALVSMVWSHSYLAGVEAIRWFVLSLLLWVGQNTLTRLNLPLLLWGVHWGALLASVWAALQFWLDIRLFPQGASPASTFINRNFFAEYAVCALPFSVYLLATLRRPRWLIWQAMTVAFIAVAIMMTGTRSALLALLLQCVVFAIIGFRYRQQLVIGKWSRSRQVQVGLVLMLTVLGLGSIPSGNARILTEHSGSTALQRGYLRASSMVNAKAYTEGSFSIRAVLWKASARMMLDHPLTGVGAGAWEVQIPLYQGAAHSLEADYFAHNEFLQLLSEYGCVVGGLFLAVLFAYLLQAASKTWSLAGADLEQAPLRGMVLCSLLTLLIVSNAGFAWHLAATGALFALCLAVLAASDAQLAFPGSFFAATLRWHPNWSLAMLCGLAGCTLLAAFVTYQAASAERSLVQAIVLADSLRQPQHAGDASFNDRKTQALEAVRAGMAINPHYRKLTAEVAEPFAAGGDWANAVWILASVAASRPHVYAIWSGLATGYARLGRHDQARQAFVQVQRLKPDAISTLTLELILLASQGRTDKATELINTHFQQGRFDYDMVQSGYALGYQTGNWPLAIRSLTLRMTTWPEHAPDAFFRLGQLYSSPSLHDEAKALAAFRQGLAAVPVAQKGNYLSQVPAKFRSQM